MRILTPDRSRAAASDAEQWNLIDVLHDVVDEFDAGNCDLPTFAYEVGAIIMALDTAADPVWLAALCEQWVKLRVLTAEQQRPATARPGQQQGGPPRAIADNIRHLIASGDAPAAQTDAAHL
jgi:hypothetical protein